MTIEQKADNQWLLTFSGSLGQEQLQSLINFAKYLEATANSKATASQANQLAEEVNESWWEKNKDRFLK